MSKVTIQDIADALGVSRNTVSKAINNADGLADATREKILQKAVEMGYKQFSYVRAVAAVAGEEEIARPSPGFQGEIRLYGYVFRWVLSIRYTGGILGFLEQVYLDQPVYECTETGL